jgi:hypothetical protein
MTSEVVFADRFVRSLCTDGSHHIAWVERRPGEREFRVLRSSGLGPAEVVFTSKNDVSLAFAGGDLYAGTREGIMRIEAGRTVSVHSFERVGEMILKGTESLVALVYRAPTSSERGTWQVLEFGDRLRLIDEVAERPFALSTVAGVWVASATILEETPLGSRTVDGVQIEASLVVDEWHIELDAAGGPEMPCSRVVALAPLEVSAQRENRPEMAGGVLFIEAAADGARIVELRQDGTRLSYERFGGSPISVAAYGDGFCWTDGGSEVFAFTSRFPDERPRVVFYDDRSRIVQQVMSFGSEMLALVSEGPLSAATLVRLAKW